MLGATDGGQRFANEYYRMVSELRRVAGPRSRRSPELYNYGTALSWHWKAMVDGTSFSQMMAKASSPQYLGDPQFVRQVLHDFAATLMRSWADMVADTPLDDWCDAFEADTKAFALTLSGQAEGVVRIGTWENSATQKAAIDRHLFAESGIGGYDLEQDITIHLEGVVDLLDLALRHALLSRNGLQAGWEKGERLSPFAMAYYCDLALTPRQFSEREVALIGRYIDYLADVIMGVPVTGTFAALVLGTAPSRLI
jgi:hypothetical protein